MTDEDERRAIRERKLRELMELQEQTDMPAAGDAAPAAPEPAGPAWPEGVMDVTDATFQEEVEKYPLALVDFWAPWCGPCHTLSPIVEELAGEMHGKVAFLKVNTDQNPETARTYGIQSLPTLMIFRDGRPVDNLVGVQPKPRISAALRRHTQRRGTPGPRRL